MIKMTTHIKLQTHKKIYLIEHFPIHCKLQNGSLWYIRRLSVTTQTRLLRQKNCFRGTASGGSCSLNNHQMQAYPLSVFPLHIALKTHPQDCDPLLRSFIWQDRRRKAALDAVKCIFKAKNSKPNSVWLILDVSITLSTVIFPQLIK